MLTVLDGPLRIINYPVYVDIDDFDAYKGKENLVRILNLTVSLKNSLKIDINEDNQILNILNLYILAWHENKILRD